MKKKKIKKYIFDLFIAIKLHCNLFNRALASHGCHARTPCSAHMSRCGACLSIALPYDAEEKNNMNKKSFHFGRRTKQPNRMCIYNKLNLKCHKISWTSSRRRSDADRSQCTCFFLWSFSDSADFLSLLMMKERNSRSAMYNQVVSVEKVVRASLAQSRRKY